MESDTHVALASFRNKSVVNQVVIKQERLLGKLHSLGFFEVFAQC
jgi:hypothetical protein